MAWLILRLTRLDYASQRARAKEWRQSKRKAWAEIPTELASQNPNEINRQIASTYLPTYR